jgi:hypothetical protein
VAIVCAAHAAITALIDEFDAFLDGPSTEQDRLLSEVMNELKKLHGVAGIQQELEDVRLAGLRTAQRKRHTELRTRLGRCSPSSTGCGRAATPGAGRRRSLAFATG